MRLLPARPLNPGDVQWRVSLFASSGSAIGDLM